MARPEDCGSLPSNSLSALNINNTTYRDNEFIENPRQNGYQNACPLVPMTTFSASSNPPLNDKDKGQSEKLVYGTSPAAGPDTPNTAELNILPSPNKLYNQQIYGSSKYFKGTFFNFNPNIVDLNQIGITYEYGDYYFVLVPLPHPETSKPVLQCGFLNRSLVGSYLLYEWHSLIKEQIGERGLAVCGDDGRWAVHSGMLQFLRCLCGKVAKALQHQNSLYMQKWGVKLGAEKVKAQLLERFMTVFGQVEWDMKMKEKEKAKDADKFMEEFMVFDV